MRQNPRLTQWLLEGTMMLTSLFVLETWRLLVAPATSTWPIVATPDRKRDGLPPQLRAGQLDGRHRAQRQAIPATSETELAATRHGEESIMST